MSTKCIVFVKKNVWNVNKVYYFVNEMCCFC
nr:MAG TPA: hypothetical protein [Caudoviricetes sp.]